MLRNTKIFYLATQMEHDQSSYFCRGPDDFCWGLAPVGPILVTGLPFKGCVDVAFALR